jgi:type I restriction enzyme S subunit
MRAVVSGQPTGTVGDVLRDIQSGRSVKTKERPAETGEFGILKVSAVTWGTFRPEENKAILDDYDPGECPRPMHGDILISRANTRNLVGAPVLVEGDHPQLLLSDKILKLVPDKNLADNRYLARALRSSVARRHFAGRAGGTSGSMTNVTQEDIRAVPLYLPTLPEQRRIADILDKADAIRHKRKEAIALTDDLLHSAFLDMFGDPVTNPKGWNVKPLEDLVDQHRGISYGVVQRGPEVVDGVPVVRISNFGDNRFDGSNVVRTSSEISNSFRRTILRGGELVVSIRGTVGRVAVVPRLAFGWNVSREVAVVPLLDGVSRALVHRALLSDGVQRFILGNVKGVAQSGINLSDLRQAPIPCPPPREVDRFERVALTTAEMERSIVSASERSEDLFNTLVQEAFSIPTPRELER